MLVSARPPAACLPLPRCAFASLPHWFISSLTHWTPVLFILWTEAANQWSSGPLLHVEQCSFCEQKQRSNGTMPQRLTINIAVRARGDMRHWGQHHCTAAPWIAVPFGHRRPQAERSCAYSPRYQVIAPLCLRFRPIVLRLRSAASDRSRHPEAEEAQNVQNWNSTRKHWFSAAYNSILKLAIWQSSTYTFVESGLKLNSSISTY